MIRLQYFASFRERLGLDAESLPWTPALTSLRAVRDLLAERGETWASTLAHSGLMCARNEVLCDLDEPLRDGDDIAFFPPVTGG